MKSRSFLTAPVAVGFFLAGFARAATDNNMLDLLSSFIRPLHYEIAEGPSAVVLPGGIKAETIVFRRVSWESKEVTQRITPTWSVKPEAMPEAEWLKTMKRVADHIQVWVVPLADHPEAGARWKDSLPATPEPHQNYRELAFLGQGHDWAWYGFMPIFEWVPLQRELKLQGGDDPLAAAVRGLSVVDRGQLTANSVGSILVQAGTNAFRYLQPVLASPNYYGGLFALAQIPGREAADWLIQCTHSTNAPLATSARHLLSCYARPELEEMYFQWLEQDAGKVPLGSLLGTCAKINKARMGPWLPRILASPGDARELRTAFELSRSLAGKEIPAELLQAEETIKRHRVKGGPNYDPAKVDQAVAVLSNAQDVDAAAHIGISLSLAGHKNIDWRTATEPGRRVLKSLPNSQGRLLAKTLCNSCRESNVQEALWEVFQ